MKIQLLMEKSGLSAHSLLDLRRKTIKILPKEDYNDLQIGLVVTGINAISTDEHREIIFTLEKVFLSSVNTKLKICFIEKITFTLDRGWTISVNEKDILCDVEITK